MVSRYTPRRLRFWERGQNIIFTRISDAFRDFCRSSDGLSQTLRRFHPLWRILQRKVKGCTCGMIVAVRLLNSWKMRSQRHRFLWFWTGTSNFVGIIMRPKHHFMELWPSWMTTGKIELLPSSRTIYMLPWLNTLPLTVSCSVWSDFLRGLDVISRVQSSRLSQTTILSCT